LLDFCVRHGISHMDVHVIMDTRDGQYIVRNPDLLKILIVSAHEKSISVGALRGDPRMFFRENQEASIKQLEALVAFEKTLPEGIHLSAVKYDVEPYATPEWKAGGEDREQVMRDYVAFLHKAQSLIREEVPHMQLTVDIPFWWDTEDLSLEVAGEEKVLSKHVQDVTDCVTVMSYRRKTERIQECVQDEMKYADEIGKTVFLALETTPLKEDKHISFWGTPPENLLRVAQDIQSRLGSEKSYGGIMLHSYGSLTRYLESASENSKRTGSE